MEMGGKKIRREKKIYRNPQRNDINLSTGSKCRMHSLLSPEHALCLCVCVAGAYRHRIHGWQTLCYTYILYRSPIALCGPIQFYFWKIGITQVERSVFGVSRRSRICNFQERMSLSKPMHASTSERGMDWGLQKQQIDGPTLPSDAPFIHVVIPSILASGTDATTCLISGWSNFIDISNASVRWICCNIIYWYSVHCTCSFALLFGAEYDGTRAHTLPQCSR